MASFAASCPPRLFESNRFSLRAAPGGRESRNPGCSRRRGEEPRLARKRKAASPARRQFQGSKTTPLGARAARLCLSGTEDPAPCAPPRGAGMRPAQPQGGGTSVPRSQEPLAGTKLPCLRRAVSPAGAGFRGMKLRARDRDDHSTSTPIPTVTIQTPWLVRASARKFGRTLPKSALKNSIPSRARALSAKVPFPRLEIPSGYSSVRKPKFALEISCRPLESDLFNTL